MVRAQGMGGFCIAFPDIQAAFYFSVLFTLTALAVFGFVKGKFTGVSKIKSALQTVLVGGAAAGVAYALAKLISQVIRRVRPGHFDIKPVRSCN